MNIETREIRNQKDITAEEKASGKWVPVARRYVQKQPISDADYARIMADYERRIRRAMRKLNAND
jgi:hypothetical protein